MTLRKNVFRKCLALFALTSFTMLLSGESLAFAPAPTLPGGTPPSAGSRYDEGYGLGQRNGALIAQRLYDRTLKAGGCSQLENYQDALLKVNRSIKAPNLNQDTDQELVRGFFRGYLDSVRKSILDSRKGCKKIRFTSGLYPGQFYGSLLCQATRVNVDLVHTLEVVPLYDGWAGGSTTRSRECEASGSIEIKSCGLGVSSPIPAVVLDGLRLACKP
jgi:hypothetical protein